MEQPTTRKKLEQGRAAHAFDSVNAAKRALKDKAVEYKAYSKKLPMLIKVNGLGAALAFMIAKGHKSDAWKILYQNIEDWLLEDHKQLISFEEDRLLKELWKSDSTTYRTVTYEVLAYLSWVKRFVDSQIQGEETQVDN